jgi:hypothetical protein
MTTIAEKNALKALLLSDTEFKKTGSCSRVALSVRMVGRSRVRGISSSKSAPTTTLKTV